MTAISKIMRDEAFKRLVTIRDSRKEAVEQLFKNMRGQMHGTKDDPFIQQALADFNTAFARAQQHVGKPEWNTIVKRTNSRLRDITHDHGWSDLLLLNPEGGIVFTVAARDDLGRIIADSFLKNTSLGAAWRAIRDTGNTEIILSEFSPYPPANDQQTAFMMAPVLDTTGTLTGYVATPIGTSPIDAIVQQRADLAQSGEPYLVGQVADNTLYRRNRLAKTGRFGDPETDPFAKQALFGATGSKMKIGSTGQVELVSYAPLTIPGLHWAILVTVSAKDAITPTSMQDTSQDLFSQYVQEQGLYDLRLISPDGTIFYSVKEEADYQTNLVHGPFAHTNLGRLVQSTLQSKQAGIADFAPYDPSGGLQSAFLVEPVLAGNEIELLVALQFGHADLDSILHKREGMGQTGETFLVGELQGRVSYRHDRLAGKGLVGQAIPPQLTPLLHKEIAGLNTVVDDTGTATLVSHIRLEIPGLHWTLLATIDTQEVQAPIQATHRK